MISPVKGQGQQVAFVLLFIYFLHLIIIKQSQKNHPIIIPLSALRTPERNKAKSEEDYIHCRDMFRVLLGPSALVPRIPRARGLVTLNNDLIHNLKSHKIIPDGKYRSAAGAEAKE